MDLKIEVTPPTEPSYTLTLTLTKHELIRLTNVLGGITGTGPTRVLTDAIYNELASGLGDTNLSFEKQIDHCLTLTGK